MQDTVRRVFSMAARTRDFLRTHPSTDASFSEAEARLEAAITLGETLGAQETKARITEHAANARRDGLRQDLLGRQLRHVVRVAGAAAKSRPDLALKFVMPARKAPNQTILIAAKSMLAAAIAEKVVLLKHGLGDGFLDELSATVAAYEAASTEANEAYLAHMACRTKLLALAEEDVETVGILDALVVSRFRETPELVTAWKGATNVVSRARAKAAQLEATLPVPVAKDDPEGRS